MFWEDTRAAFRRATILIRRHSADFPLHYLTHFDLWREGGEPDAHHNSAGFAVLETSPVEQIQLQQMISPPHNLTRNDSVGGCG
jgi:hypothetical protein